MIAHRLECIILIHALTRNPGGLDLQLLVQEDEISVSSVVQRSLLCLYSKALGRMQGRCFDGVDGGAVGGTLEDANALVKWRNASAERVCPSDKRLSIAHLNLILSEAVATGIQSQGRDGVSDEDESLWMDTMGDPQGSWVSVDTVRDDSKVNLLSCGDFVAGEQAD